MICWLLQNLLADLPFPESANQSTKYIYASARPTFDGHIVWVMTLSGAYMRDHINLWFKRFRFWLATRKKAGGMAEIILSPQSVMEVYLSSFTWPVLFVILSEVHPLILHHDMEYHIRSLYLVFGLPLQQSTCDLTLLFLIPNLLKSKEKFLLNFREPVLLE